MEATKSKLGKYYDELPVWAKGVVGIIVVGGSAFLIYTVIKKIKADAELQKAKKTLATSQSELDALINNGIAASYTKSQYDGFANEIVEQFTGCDFSTTPFGVVLDYMDMSNSGKKLYDIVSQLNNNRDFLELVNSFDIRTYDDCGYFTGNVENVNLYQAVNNELQNGEIKFINEQMKNRGITYQF